MGINPDDRPLSFSDPFNTALKAAADRPRLRILALLAEAELTVSDFTESCASRSPAFRATSAPDRGRADRALSRRRLGLLPPCRRAEAPTLPATLLGGSIPHDPTVARDRERLAAVRAARAAGRARPISAPRRRVGPHPRAACGRRRRRGGDRRRRSRDRPFRSLLDLGTGTGRMLELFGPHIERGLGIDMSLDMLAVARARLERAGLRHCSVRQGDIYDLPVPKDSFDVVIIHQVLHFLDDGARAIREAARVLRPGGRLLVVDFAPHDLEFLREQHAHRRLGFAAETIAQWMKRGRASTS